MQWLLKQKKHIFTIIIFLAIYGAIRTYQLSGYQQGEAPPINEIGILGQDVKLSDFRGRPVLIYFWATWCPVCKLEHGTIESLAEDYPVLTVASWSNDEEAVKNYFKNASLRQATIDDPAGAIASRYGVSATPSFFIVGPHGQIRFVERGYTSSLGLRLRLWLASYK